MKLRKAKAKAVVPSPVCVPLRRYWGRRTVGLGQFYACASGVVWARLFGRKSLHACSDGTRQTQAARSGHTNGGKQMSGSIVDGVQTEAWVCNAGIETKLKTSRVRYMTVPVAQHPTGLDVDQR